MTDYAAQIASLRLYKELESSADRDGMTATDVKQLVAMVNDAAAVAGPLLELIPQTFKQYTNHNIGHCRNLIDLMGRFIPQETLGLMNGLELAVLLLSALLHDFGMFVTDRERTEALKRDTLASPDFDAFTAGHHARAVAIAEARRAGEYERAEVVQDSLLADFFRRMHAERARDNVKTNLKDKLVFRYVDISPYVLDVCESHAWAVHESNDPQHPEKAVSRLQNIFAVYGFPLNLQYIACCLRLADIMDFDRSRTPLVVFQNIDFKDEKSWEEWNKHLSVVGWQINEREVMFHTECSHPSFYVAVMEFLDWVDSELSECRRLLVKEAPASVAARYKLHLPPVVDRSDVEMADKSYLAGAFRFQLEYDRIMRLLMDRSLYPDPSLFLRELLQNSLDACRNREAHAREYGYEGFYTPRVAVWDHSGDAASPRVVFQDNGVGMSRKIVENYFMRVGRSYYRSPEFDAERARLKKKGIELEATSQFGIGILSCFMVADRFEVTTHRVGHVPLHITIEGPTKYFVIKLLDPPPPTPFPVRPASDAEDGPPLHAGTSITVHLRPGANVDVFQTLDTFAVNVDYDIAVYRGDSPEPRVIPRRRWESAEHQRGTLADAVASRQSGYYSGPSEEQPPGENYAPRPGVDENLKEVLALSRVPFEKYEFSSHLGGAAWFWLLRDEAGGVCPERGYLSISSGVLSCTGLPGFLGYATSYPNRVPVDSEEWRMFVRRLKDFVGRSLSPEQEVELYEAVKAIYSIGIRPTDESGRQQVEDVTRGFASGWLKLSDEEQEYAREYFESFTAGGKPWFELPGIPERLLRAEKDWAGQSPHFDDSLSLRVWPQAVALHGVLLPAGVVKWDPMSGYARKLRLLSGVGGAQIDSRGVEAPVPAASRLFVETKEGAKVVIPFARAVLRHAVELATQDGQGGRWLSWFASFMYSIRGLYFWPEALFAEFELCEAVMGYTIGHGGRRMWRQELIKKYGKWVPVGGNTPEAIFPYRDSTVTMLLTFRPRRKRGKQWEVDMESLLPPQEETMEKAIEKFIKELRGW